MFQSILIATDFSPAAWKAVHVGLKLGDSQQARVSLLHIFPTDMINSDLPATLQKRINEIKINMKKFCKELTLERNEEVINEVRTGKVKKELMNFIDEHKFDLVIMGLNGDGSSNETGSNTKHLIEQSSTPILVIPNDFLLDD